MSRCGDYLHEMDLSGTTDVEIDNLLSGSPSLGENLAPLADFFAGLRNDDGNELDDEAIARIVAVAAAAATRPAPAPVRSLPQDRSPLRNVRRRAAAFVVAATVVVGGTSGLAVAADGAKPGDALYGVDRALEFVGIGAGATQERLHEAEALVNAEDVIRGLEHAADALEEQAATGLPATQILMDAAERVRAAGVDPSAVTRDRVAGLLTYIAENVGDLDGQHVAELAVHIGRPDHRSDAPASPGQPNTPGPPAQSPADPPGLTDREPGPPDHAPANPPGHDKADPGPPGHVPVDPPGQDKADPGPPGHVPVDPPGQDKADPGPPDSRPNPPKNRP